MTKTTVTVLGIKYNVSISPGAFGGAFGLSYYCTGPDGQWVTSGGGCVSVAELKKTVKRKIHEKNKKEAK